MARRVEKRPSRAAAKRQALLTHIEQFGSAVTPCVRCLRRSLVCKRLPRPGKCGECVRSACPCENMDTDAERSLSFLSFLELNVLTSI
jgi:hypothetical protein